jgi:hypothetical protein
MPFKEYDDPHLHEGYKALREGRYIDAIYHLGSVRYIPPGPADSAESSGSSPTPLPQSEPPPEVVASMKSLCELIADHPSTVTVRTMVELLQRAHAIDLASPSAQLELNQLRDYVEALYGQRPSGPINELFRPV